MATIQGIYIALFGRPADPFGLAFFNEATNNGADLTAIGDLAATAEYQSRFEGQTNVQIVNSIYQSLFNRDADLAGLTFFVNALASGELNINNIAIAIYDGAQNEDLEILQNKEAAANLFTASLDTGAEISAYSGDDAAAQGRAFLDGVTDDDDTIPTQAEVDAAIAAIVAGDGVPGGNFVLTDAVGEVVNGTENDDTFSGVLDAAGTYNVGDTINGLGGEDTFNLIVTGGSLPAGASTHDVEIINLNQQAALGAAIDATVFAGAEQIWQINNVADISELGETTTAGFRDVEADATVGFTGATGNIALDNADDDSDIEIAGGDLTMVNISGTMDDDGATPPNPGRLDLSVDGTVDDLMGLNIALSSDAEVTLDSTILDLSTFSMFDASGSTGGLEVDFDNATTGDYLTDIMFGSGGDTVSYDLFEANNEAGGATVMIDLGAGLDQLTVNAQGNAVNNRLEITTGAGADAVIEDGSFDNIVDGSEAEFENGIVSITDFNPSEDALNVSAVGGTVNTLTGPELADIENEASLFDALGVASGYAAANEITAFDYDGNAYVWYDASGDGAFGDGDGLIELQGVEVDQLNASNFVA